MKPFLILCLSFGVIGLLGCGSAREAPLGRVADQGQKGGEQKPAGGAEVKATPRKIIYTGFVDVIVDDFDGSEGRLLQLVQEHEGYLAESDIYNQPGTPRSGTWKVRVSTKRFEAFLHEVAKLGEVRKRTSNSQDITDAYFDRAARLKADEAEEKSLLGLLEKTQGKVEDILKVREQLRIVRGHIEENKGQLQRWDKDVDFATVTVKLLDRRDYKPPLLPDFSSTLGRTFQGSIDTLVAFGKGIVLVVVALAPWLAVLGLLAAPFVIIWRRRRAANTVVPAPAAPGGSGQRISE